VCIIVMFARCYFKIDMAALPMVVIGLLVYLFDVVGFPIIVESNMYCTSYLNVLSQNTISSIPQLPPARRERTTPPSRNEASLESLAEMQARRKEKQRKGKNLHKTLERAEDYSEITHMGASREARGLEWGFVSRIVPE